MENAIDALYIGFAILMFVVALSVSIFAFSTVTNASQQIIDSRDRENMYIYVKESGTTRTVTAEDIIPALYRAYYENYMIRFEGIGNLYKVKSEKNDTNTTDNYVESNIIDLEKQNIGTQKDANRLINSLLEGSFEELLANDIDARFKYFKALPNVKLYDTIKEKTFKEEIGLFYTNDRDNPENQIDDVNKIKKRIITYTVEP